MIKLAITSFIHIIITYFQNPVELACVLPLISIDVSIVNSLIFQVGLLLISFSSQVAISFLFFLFCSFQGPVHGILLTYNEKLIQASLISHLHFYIIILFDLLADYGSFIYHQYARIVLNNSTYSSILKTEGYLKAQHSSTFIIKS